MHSGAPIPIDSLTVARPKERERLLIVDASVLLADSIANAVLAAGYGAVQGAPSPCVALRFMTQRAPTMVLADLELVSDNDFELLQAIVADFPQTRVIVMIDGVSDPHLAVDALIFGASGLACRDLGIVSLLRVLDLVRQGETAVPQRMNGLLVSALRQRPVRPSAKVRLSARQREVLKMVAKGATDKDIGKTLNISLTTVRSHLTAIFEKTETVNRTTAALWASAYIDEAAS